MQPADPPPSSEPQSPLARPIWFLPALPWSHILAERRTLSQSLSRATWFSLSATICCGLLYFIYAKFHSAGVGWAVISSILVLIPDVKQSVATALARVTANVIGAICGLIVAKAVGDGTAAIILAVVIVAFACHIFRLDLGLRTACVGVIIVMTANLGDVTMTSLSRFVAVIVGCGTGVSVQLLVLVLQRSTRRITPSPSAELTVSDSND